MDFKKVLKMIIAIASFAGLAYHFGKKFLDKKSKENVDKVKYVSFDSKDDDFISEEVVEKLA